MLLGLIRPTSGRVRLFGAEPGPASLARVGALIEGPAFYPYLSGRANLRVLADHAGVPRSRVDAVLDVVTLTERAKDKYATYSLGMKQRLGLAAALLKKPELVVLDEPTNGLDPAGMADMRVTLRKLAADGCTVLLSSHLLAEIELICDRVGVLDHGPTSSPRRPCRTCGRVARCASSPGRSTRPARTSAGCSARTASTPTAPRSSSTSTPARPGGSTRRSSAASTSASCAGANPTWNRRSSP